MATAMASADCEVVDTKADVTPEPIQLCMFVEPISAADMFSRTARYAENPEKYLQNTLGHDVFKDRKSMLSIPDEVDMDRYGSGAHKQHFEQHIAGLLGKQHGLFFITGVQAQLAALRIWHGRHGNGAAWHVSSHLESAEERSFEELYGLKRSLLGSDPESLPTVDEIGAVLNLPSDQRPAVVLIEVPNRVLGCKTYTFSELAQISVSCKEAGVALHMDGARLWEIEPYYQATAGKSFAEVAALFDSVYVSFYKGMRGATGAMLASNDESLIAEAKVWQRRAGGNCYTFGFEIIDDERGFNENIGTFARKREKMIEVVEGVTAATGKFKTASGEHVVSFVPEKPTCCQIHTVFQGYTAEELAKARDKVQARTNVRVFERLRPKETVDETLRADRRSAPGKKAQDVVEDRRHFMEWMIVAVTEKLETRVFVDAYVALCKELEAAKSQ